jgi:hypothetical protein
MRRSGAFQSQLWIAAVVSFLLTYYLVRYVSRDRTPIDRMVWLSAGEMIVIMSARGQRQRASRENPSLHLLSPWLKKRNTAADDCSEIGVP